jgi:hypothetical protein
MPIPVEISYGGVTVKVDAQKLFGELLGFVNKKKKYVCLL